jgi:hypothetical protein
MTPKNQHKITFVTNWGAYVCLHMMPFGVKNGPPTYQRVIIKVICEYIDVFMKIFLTDFIVFSNLSTHFEKFMKCFLTQTSVQLWYF